MKEKSVFVDILWDIFWWEDATKDKNICGVYMFSCENQAF